MIKRAIVVVGHGSRREEANRDVIDVAKSIAVRGGFPIVEAAFLEIARPTIDEAFSTCVALGATEVIVHPYFLSPGRHTRGDLPVEVRTAASRHTGLSYRITEPLSAHPLVIEAAIERIRETEEPTATRREQKFGTVYLVGAGPGDPGLLTIKALDLLRKADVVVYDYLVNQDLLAHAPRGADRIYVGKVGGGRQTDQEEINRLLIERARDGCLVVRLKGGDPFLFGRGGEEALALQDAGIQYEIVPGISSALAVPGYAGIPLTHRGLSASVAIVTGARAGDGRPLSEQLRGCTADTIVVLMGVMHLREISSDLIASGRSAKTPAAMIRWGTYDAQETVTATLGTIADTVERAGLGAPSLIVIGEVVRLRDQLQWFESRNIAGEACAMSRWIEDHPVTS